MSEPVKSKLYKLIDEIEDEKLLNQLMEEAAYYVSKKDVVDELTPAQLKELDKAIEEADNNETVTWNDFEKEMDKWKKQ